MARTAAWMTGLDALRLEAALPRLVRGPGFGMSGAWFHAGVETWKGKMSLNSFGSFTL